MSDNSVRRGSGSTPTLATNTEPKKYTLKEGLSLLNLKAQKEPEQVPPHPKTTRLSRSSSLATARTKITPTLTQPPIQEPKQHLARQLMGIIGNPEQNTQQKLSLVQEVLSPIRIEIQTANKKQLTELRDLLTGKDPTTGKIMEDLEAKTLAQLGEKQYPGKPKNNQISNEIRICKQMIDERLKELDKTTKSEQKS